MKNHSQIKELGWSDEELYNKLVGRKSKTSNLPGLETPLGHAYSIILEKLSERGLDANPDPSYFLETIKKELIKGGYSYEAKYLDLTNPSYYGGETNGIMKYMINKGLSDLDCEGIMKKILGPNCGRTFAPEYRVNNICRFFKNK